MKQGTLQRENKGFCFGRNSRHGQVSCTCRANQLLDQTAPEHEHKGEEPWIEACLLQLAIDNEIEAETAELGLAMQASLDNIERLREQYCEDDIQSTVSAFADSDVGLLLKTYEFLEEMDASVVKSFLEFEKRCVCLLVGVDQCKSQ
jgi:hypothetical protein